MWSMVEDPVVHLLESKRNKDALDSYPLNAHGWHQWHTAATLHQPKVSRRSGCCPAMALRSWSGERSACDKTCIRVGVSCLRAAHTRYTKIGPVTLGRWRPKRKVVWPHATSISIPAQGSIPRLAKASKKACV